VSDVLAIGFIAIIATIQTCRLVNESVSALATTPIEPRLDLWWFERAQFLAKVYCLFYLEESFFVAKQVN